jgi:hypothetical protein
MVPYCLFLFTSKGDYDSKIVQEGGLAPLIQMLGHSNEKIQEQAVATVRNLSVES